jgi:hypothetical protein
MQLRAQPISNTDAYEVALFSKPIYCQALTETNLWFYVFVMHNTLVVGCMVFCQRIGIATELAVVTTTQFQNSLELSCPSYYTGRDWFPSHSSGACSVLSA